MHPFLLHPHQAAARLNGLSLPSLALPRVEPFVPPRKRFQISSITLDLEFLGVKKASNAEQVDAPTLSDQLLRRFVSQVLTSDQRVNFEFQGTNYVFGVAGILVEGQDAAQQRGILSPKTQIIFQAVSGSGIKILNQRTAAKSLMLNVSFEQLGIGGMDKQFSEMFRRAFASRNFPPEVVQKLGITHVKGILLFGPPGTGKTLIARQIGKMLNGREPKIVNGPEVLSKFVGQSEENVRDLFKEAEAEQASAGDASELHIIIFDEIDSICKARGTSRDGTGVGDRRGSPTRHSLLCRPMNPLLACAAS